MKRGWFTIPGLQAGERDLSERIAPLGTVLAAAKGRSIADFGCAEGLIGKWLLDAGGARSLHGFEKHPPYVDTARQILAGYPARFDVVDLDDREALNPLLWPHYGVVLALNVIQKLKRPDLFLRTIADRCDDVLALSLPARVLMDARSDRMLLDPEQFLRGEFELVEQHDGHVDRVKGHFGVRLIFKRTRRG